MSQSRQLSEDTRILEQKYRRAPQDPRVTTYYSYHGDLVVNTFVTELNFWSCYGTSPWLHNIDVVDWVVPPLSDGTNSWISYWKFQYLSADWNDTDAVQGCTLTLKVWWDEIHTPNPPWDTAHINVWIYDGSSWIQKGQYYPSYDQQWVDLNIDVSSNLNTAGKINAARLKFRFSWAGEYGQVFGVTYAYLHTTMVPKSETVGETG